MSELSRTWYIVVNPNAGSGKTISEWVKAERCLSECGVAYTHFKTERKGHAVDIVLSAVSEGYRRFVAVGGDGTAHEVLNGIMLSVDRDPSLSISDFALAVIPIGSGNDWIKTSLVPYDTEKAVRLIAAESFSRQDVVRVTSLSEPSLPPKYMLNIGGSGFDSRVCVIVNAQKDQGRRNRAIYLLALVRVLLHPKACPVEVVSDGKTLFSGDFFSLAFGIGKYCGGGMRQCPWSLLDDGLLDVTVIPSMPLYKLLTKLPKVYTDKLPLVKGVKSAKAREIIVRTLSGSTHPVELDGEVIFDLPARFEVVPGQLPIISGSAL